MWACTMRMANACMLSSLPPVAARHAPQVGHALKLLPLRPPEAVPALQHTSHTSHLETGTSMPPACSRVELPSIEHLQKRKR